MKRDSKLSGALHVLLHLAEHRTALTSETLAKVIGTNPVVVRRTLSGLRKCGFVNSAKGHGGGWTLACDLSEVTLLDVYLAVGSPQLFAIGHRSESPGCLIEMAVNQALESSLSDAKNLLLKRLGEVTLASLSADFHARLNALREQGGMDEHQHRIFNDLSGVLCYE